MRGLDARIQMAHHRIALVAGLDGEHEFMCAWESAKSQGYDDAMQGYDDAPLMFTDEPHLLNGWQEGQDLYWSIRELQECEHCRNNWSDPCPVHG